MLGRMSREDERPFTAFEHAGWEQSVERYEASFGRLTRQAVPPLLDALGVALGTRLLDVATGPGYVAASARERGASVVALDFSQAMLAKARALHPAIDFRLGDAEQLPFDAGTFDAVAMSFGLLHLGDPERALREAQRVLVRGGRFGFTVWAEPDHARAFRVVLDAVARHGATSVDLPRGPDFFFYSDPANARSALERAGFVDARVELNAQTWRLESPDELFEAFHRGTARTGGLLRRQSAAALERIAADVRAQAQTFAAADGRIEIPMPARIAWAAKP
jgi:ubiquinone/menaquinone biosynthesis C-methylase UbiE